MKPSFAMVSVKSIELRFKGSRVKGVTGLRGALGTCKYLSCLYLSLFEIKENQDFYKNLPNLI